jgi:hypothetical protein
MFTVPRPGEERGKRGGGGRGRDRKKKRETEMKGQRKRASERAGEHLAVLLETNALLSDEAINQFARCHIKSRVPYLV